jgi:hypothetical protein
VIKSSFRLLNNDREGNMANKIFIKIKNKLPGFARVLITMSLTVFLMYLLAACTSENAAAAAIGTGVAGLMGVFVCLYVLAFAAGIFSFVVWVIALVDCARRENLEFPSPSENSKVLWILIIVLAGGVGAIIYYFLVMKKMPKKK